MAATESLADLSAFKSNCKESTLRKMQAMLQLSEAMNGEGGIGFSTLVPLASIINSIVNKDRPAYDIAIAELRSCIAQKNKGLTLQDLSSIAEINFLEGFDAFISYIHVGQPRADADMNLQSPNVLPQSPIVMSNPKRRAPKRLQIPKKEEPTRKAARLDVKQQEPKQPTRKSTRRTLDEGVKFNCVFNGCTDEFSSANDLTHHAENCSHKLDLILVFCCSYCKQKFLSDKAVKSHIWSSFKCAGATIKVESAKDKEEIMRASRRRSHSRKSAPISRDESMDSSIMDDRLIKCAIKKCKYSNVNPELLYVHVKSSHLDANTTFKCINCGETKSSGRAIKNHITNTCINAKIELKIRSKTGGTESNVLPNIPRTASVSTEKWDVALSMCPIQTCGFSGSKARDMTSHFKKMHSESRLSYQCSGCGQCNNSMQSVIKHCKSSCTNSHPEVLVNGNIMTRRTPRARSSVQTPTSMVMRKRGRPSVKSSSKKGKGENSEVDVADMPVLEMIQIDDDDDVEVTRVMTRNKIENEETVDVVSMDDEDFEVEELSEVRDVFNISVESSAL